MVKLSSITKVPFPQVVRQKLKLINKFEDLHWKYYNDEITSAEVDNELKKMRKEAKLFDARKLTIATSGSN